MSEDCRDSNSLVWRGRMKNWDTPVLEERHDSNKGFTIDEISAIDSRRHFMNDPDFDQVNLAIDYFDEHEHDWAWDQLSRVERYLSERTDLAYLDLYHNGESAELYETWQLAGDAMWLVRDALKGRFPLVGRREITSVEVLFDREGGSL